MTIDESCLISVRHTSGIQEVSGKSFISETKCNEYRNLDEAWNFDRYIFTENTLVEYSIHDENLLQTIRF